ncbi:MAG TPA: membrane protein insertase YidC [Rhizomicrobium sp.]|nr:membrane protein insertase YidC [Rhizomicrobium sp.]
MNDNRNLLTAVLLCAAVIFGWQFFVANPQMKAEQARLAATQHEKKAAPQPGLKTPLPGQSAAQTAHGQSHISRAAALSQSPRVRISTATVDGSINLKGARFDDLRLKKYRTTVEPNSPEIVLLAPQGTEFPYFAVFGWVAPPGSTTKVPDDTTEWKQVGGTTLSTGKPVTLEWDNGQGLIFTRTITIDDRYMFSVSDTVKNTSSAAATLYPYAFVTRDGVPKTAHFWMLHEGFVGYGDGRAKYTTYDDLKAEKPSESFASKGGWVGITDKYWMTTVIPPQTENFSATYTTSHFSGPKAHQADYRLDARHVAPGATLTVKQHLFAGAKVVQTLRDYEKQYTIHGFDYAIDWGWFFFLTRPMFVVLDFFYKLVGNFGIAILLLTVAVKLLFFPLADASYRSMSRMKKLQPEMERIKTRLGDDRVKQQQEMMELYKREKVNPVSGCLPMLIQIPVFFALYKVLFVTIEMRHAPFFGWIKDLSAHDPTSILNLFGLFPWHIPHFIPAFLSIGIWPILMGITQFVQTKLNPAPADPIQAKMFLFMPIIFTFMLATFPAGLVIYWTWNNLLSIGQQIIMMKRTGTPIEIFDNFRKAKAPAGE